MKFNVLYNSIIGEAKLDQSNLPEQDKEWVKEYLPDLKLQAKYVPWIEREYKNPNNLVTVSMISKRAAEFEKFLPYIPPIEKDIYKHDFYEALTIINEAKEAKEANEAKAGLKAKRSDTIDIYEDDNWLLVMPTTIESAQYWGMQNGKNAWCICSRQNNVLVSYVYEKNAYYIMAYNKKFHSGPASKFCFEILEEMNLPKCLAVYNYNDNSYKDLLEVTDELDGDDHYDEINEIEKLNSIIQVKELRPTGISEYDFFNPHVADLRQMSENGPYGVQAHYWNDYLKVIIGAATESITIMDSYFSSYLTDSLNDIKRAISGSIDIDSHFEDGWIADLRSKEGFLFWESDGEDLVEFAELFKKACVAVLGNDPHIDSMAIENIYFMAAPETLFEGRRNIKDAVKLENWNKKLVLTIKMELGLDYTILVDFFKSWNVGELKEDKEFNADLKELIDFIQS